MFDRFTSSVLKFLSIRLLCTYGSTLHRKIIITFIGDELKTRVIRIVFSGKVEIVYAYDPRFTFYVLLTSYVLNQPISIVVHVIIKRTLCHYSINIIYYTIIVCYIITVVDNRF